MSTFKGFIDEKDQLIFLEALRKENKEELEALIKRASQFVEGRYVFQNDWDMEKTNEVEKLDLMSMNWNHNPKGDPEWTFMLNRHAFLLDVAISYQETGNEKYLNYLKTFILCFIEEAPLTDENKQTSWRTIDASLRLINWVRVFEVIPLAAHFTESEQQIILNSMTEHLSYLEQELEVSRGQSNWMVIEICGLMLGSLMLNQKERFQALFNLLKISLELQVEGDGLQREQSFMYHHEVLLCLLMIIHLLKRNAEKVPSWLLEFGKIMSLASRNIMTNKGKQVAFGDSDIESMIGMLEVAENVLSTPFLPTFLKEKETTLFTKLFIGLDNRDFSEREETLTSTYFKNSGVTILRNKSNTDYLLFKCGPLGGGHGHDDLLHVELEINNVPVLVDSGRYSYEVTKHNRLEFKQASAHNGITINERNFNEHTDAWDSLKVATPINQKFEASHLCQLVEGGHLGYFDEGVLVNRKVLMVETGLWLISDEIFTNKKVTAESHFHFATADLEKTTDGFTYQKDDISLHIVPSQGEGEFVLEECLISPEYNDSYQSQKLIYKRQVEKTAVQTFILTSQSFKKKINSVAVFCEGEKMPKEVVEGFEIISDNHQKEYLIIQHQEPNIGRRAYQIGDQYIYGKVVYSQLKEDNSSLERIILD